MEGFNLDQSETGSLYCKNEIEAVSDGLVSKGLKKWKKKKKALLLPFELAAN